MDICANKHILFCMKAIRTLHRIAQPELEGTCLQGVVHWIVFLEDVWRDGVLYPPGASNGLRVLITHRGRAVLHGDERDVPLEPGSLVMLAGGWNYSHRENSQGWHMSGMIINGAWASTLENALSSDTSVHRPTPARWRRELMAAIEAGLGQQSGWDWRFASHFTSFAAEWMSSREIGEGLLARVEQLVEEDLTRNWRVPELARALNVSVSAFAHGFRAEVGDSPARWLSRKRMAYARRLLVSHTATEVAEMLGFANPFHFSRVFKRMTGETPSSVRRRMSEVGNV